MGVLNEQKTAVLIVDDDITSIKLVAEYLDKEYCVSFAVTAEQGMKMALNKPQPDVILLDVMMPNISGHDMCRQLKQNPATFRIPVIFVTAMSQTNDKTHGFDLGAVDYVTKPIELPVLKARIRTHATLKLQQEMLEELSATDPLTGLANKRRYYEVIESEWARATRNSLELGLLVIDIDYFKAFNDQYGHGAGDECLQKVASIIQRSVQRPGDIVARIGGEEFAVILPRCDEKGVERVAEQIMAELNNAAIVHSFTDVSDHVTVSIGGSSMLPDLSASTHDLFRVADKALYLAKDAGRNCYRYVGL